MSAQPLMWVEKYRPKSLADMVNQKEALIRLQALLKKPEDIPHLLFTGPPGSGKTTTALVVIKEILGDYWKDFSLELNASDERGIDTIRERIKIFASHTDKRAGVPFRIVLLDEADSMTADAQTALRRIMEEFSSGTRFILTANYSSNIIEPIQSRCAIFRFIRFSKEDVTNYLEGICRKEKVKYEKEALATLYELSSGDLRLAINQLQALSSLGAVDEQSVKRVFATSKRSDVKRMVELAVKGEFSKAREILLELMFVYGISEVDILKYINEDTYSIKGIDHANLAKLIAEYDYRLIEGAHPEIQLSALLAELAAMNRDGQKS
ncbi:MAG: replication factor C small subunit [Conexivisphaerales archaeon]